MSIAAANGQLAGIARSQQLLWPSQLRSRSLTAAAAAARLGAAAQTQRVSPLTPAQPLQHHRLCTTAAPQHVCRSSSESEQPTSSSSSEGSLVPNALNAALLALWAGLMGYVFFLAPNQTPGIDSFVVQKLVGLKPDDPFEVNPVFTAVWNCMGLYPLIWASILVPGGRGEGKLPAWPFAAASVFFGAYALIPYMCLWSPPRNPEQLPLPASELEGWSRGFMRAAETPYLPAGLLAGSAYWVWQGLSAGGDAWLQYLQLFDASRLTHATSLDFVLLSLLMPFWMGNDAERRGWEQRNTLVPLLCLLPLVGPSVYLLLRPKTYGGSSNSSQE